MFYTFHQNNTFGVYDISDTLNKYVIVEAANVDQVLEWASKLGIYFDGLVTGVDCECCGPRWSYPFDQCNNGEDLFDAPTIYGLAELTDLAEVRESPKHNVVIHYTSGQIKYAKF